jgi:beta-ribofuranosylaminobenzene 5'-phosphate synthase
MKSVRIQAPARLHWGLFDISGSLGRRFGGLGVAITNVAVRLKATVSDTLTADGPDADRVLEFAQRYLAATGLRGGAHLQIEQAIPNHVGLGSGTKLALAVAQALAALYEQPADPVDLAQAVGRAQRSAVGLWTFAHGGLVVEGGRRADDNRPAPLLMQMSMPAHWYCVLAVPDQFKGLSGTAEVVAFKQIAPHADLAAQMTHLVLMSLLPALVEEELSEFGAALTRLQQLAGECYRPIQQGYYGNACSAELIESLLSGGAAGAGQSSWGPTVYALVDNKKLGQQLVDQARELLAGQGLVELVGFDNQGVQVKWST